MSCETSSTININEVTNQLPKTTSEEIDMLKDNGISMSDTISLDNRLNNSTEDQPYFLVIIDTNTNYWKLNKKMYDLFSIVDLTIDTLGRFYNAEKNLISLPEDDEDEVYAGEYIPRRFESTYLSLEYLNFYNPNSNKETITLIGGMYEDKKSADSLLTIINTVKQEAFLMKVNLFVGCMH